MAKLAADKQAAQPLLTNTKILPLAHPKPQLSFIQPNTTDTLSDVKRAYITETGLMQQLALALGRKGLDRAARRMQQDGVELDNGLTFDHPSQLSWELVSYMAWFPGWTQQQPTDFSSTDTEEQPVSFLASAHDDVMYDTAERERQLDAQWQASNAKTQTQNKQSQTQHNPPPASTTLLSSHANPAFPHSQHGTQRPCFALHIS